MYKYRKERVPMNEFLQIREKSDDFFEYIDGFVYMSPSPTTNHQRIAGRLQLAFGNYLKGNPCEVFPAPYDIELDEESEEDTRAKIVIPDISIICDKSGFTETRYVGVPDLIVEILSPSNQSHDLVTKFNLYMKYGVKEYWIVNPMLHTITVYALNDEKMYEQHDMKTETGAVTSKLFAGLSVDLTNLFQ